MINTNSNRCTLWKPTTTLRSSQPGSQELPAPVPGPSRHPVNVFKVTPRRLLIGGSALLTVAGFALYTRDFSHLQGSVKPVIMPEVPQTAVADAQALATPAPQLAVDDRNRTFRILPFPAEAPSR